MQHSYGYLPDKKDDKDFLFRAVQRVDQLPPSIDLRLYCSKVRDQGTLGSCTGFAITSGLKEFMEHKLTKIPIRFTTLSPLFLYYHERVLEDTVSYDSGAEIRDGMKVLATIGVCTEAKWPYKVKKFTIPPTQLAETNATKYTTFVYSRILNLVQMKSALATYHGVVFGFNVYESFETNEVAKTGKMPMPKAGEQVLGGHAVFVCGYMDDQTWPGGGYLIIKNSWSAGWGDKGYFYMPYEFVKGRDDVSDAWTATV